MFSSQTKYSTKFKYFLHMPQENFPSLSDLSGDIKKREFF